MVMSLRRNLLIQVILLVLIAAPQAEAQGIQVITLANPALYNPYGVALDTNGNVYVADPGNVRVVECSSDGTFISNWTTMGICSVVF